MLSVRRDAFTGFVDTPSRESDSCNRCLMRTSPPPSATAVVSAAAPTRPASPSVTGYAIGVAAESRLINA